MSQNTFPAFTNMMPTVEDIQLIVDSLRQEDRNRITKDNIFNAGIVNEQSDYLSAGTLNNSLKIKPFIAYTPNGNRLEISDSLDNLYPTGNVINVTDTNITSTTLNVPVWKPYITTFADLASSELLTQSFTLTQLGRGSVLHGIKVRINTAFGIVGATTQPEVYFSIGTSSEPEKFLPTTNISQNNDPTNLSVMNLMYSMNDAEPTDIVITYSSDSAILNTLTNGSLTINLCIANLSGFDNDDLVQTQGGFELNNSIIGAWQPLTTYHIVARYTERKSEFRGLNYTTIDGNNIVTTEEPTRVTTDYALFALRKTGTVIDFTTLDDVKLGEVVTDNNGNITNIFINGKNQSGNNYTDYLTLPGYRLVENIDARQIGVGDVTNTQFSYLNTISSNVQNQLNSKANLSTDNVFTGQNTFENQIVGSIDKVNGFTANILPLPNGLLVLDENGKVPADAVSESTFSSVGNFYTVSSGITTDGRASFITPSGNSGTVINASESNPLVFNYPNGSVEKITQNITVSGLSDIGHYYLIKEKDGNFVYLPTAGGTMACIPTVSSSNQFSFDGGVGSVYGSWNNTYTYKAFDGTLSDGLPMGRVVYKNYAGQETTSYIPDGSVAPGTPTYFDITFPTPITPTGFAACFRTGQYDITPKIWILQGSNDGGSTWSTVIDSGVYGNNTTWNINEIKNTPITTALSYSKFRFTFRLNSTNIWNYMVGEQTDQDGESMPVNCYYFQLYMTNTSSDVKGNVIEGYNRPTDMSVGSYFLDLSKKPYTGYKCIGPNQFTPINFVKLGFVDLVDTDPQNPILNCYPFCYNTFTYSDDKTTYHINGGVKELKETIAVNDTLYFDHNLGLIPNIVKVRYQCVDANEINTSGYSAGDYIDTMYVSDTLGLTSINESLAVTITTVTLHPGSAGSTLYIKHKTTGALTATSNGSWRAIIYCSRGW